MRPTLTYTSLHPAFRHLHDAALCLAGHVDRLPHGGALPRQQEQEDQGGHLVSSQAPTALQKSNLQAA